MQIVGTIINFVNFVTSYINWFLSSLLEALAAFGL